ncbi:hypothetical protein DDE82_002427 [Stemphylium lycopersici]|uniref:Uncharacterized protein n=1 Tax=Stemphylium lycopersici TaxID=183478 RepID=A0A364N4P6_STELY|nr:hypothetical protein DDE82_002427 [Stemphylium lycopersici]RAR11766.1 hypothetical protein DDE83_004493 [Stemphylium lycopersici]
MSAKREESVRSTAIGGTPRKRPLSPNTSASVPKRPATKGGFVISSDEGEDDTDDEEPTQSKSVAQQAPRPLIRRVPIQTALRTTPVTASSPAKQVNRTRLSMLLGRNRSATPAPRQSLPPSHSKGVLRSSTSYATRSPNTGNSMAGGREATPRITDKASSKVLENTQLMAADEPQAWVAPNAESKFKHQGSNSTQKQHLSNIVEASSWPSESASSTPAQLSQQRKADGISDKAGYTTILASKKLAGSLVNTATKPAKDGTTKSPLPVTKSVQPARDDGQLKKADGASVATAARNTLPVVAGGSIGREAKVSFKETSLLAKQTTADLTTIIPSISKPNTPNKIDQKQVIPTSSTSDAKKINSKPVSKPLGTRLKEYDSAHATDMSRSDPSKTTNAVDEMGFEAREPVLSIPFGSFGGTPAKSSHSQRSEDAFKGESSLGGANGETARRAHQGSVEIHATPAPAICDVAEPLRQLNTSSGAPENLPLPNPPSPARPGNEPASPEVAQAPPISPPVTASISSSSAANTNGDIFIPSQPCTILKEAVPYFEYSVFQKHWSSEQQEKDGTSIEVSVRPCTNADEANAQAERLFQSSHQYFQDMLVEHSIQQDDNGCAVFTTHIAPYDYPAKKNHIKIWVQRHAVSRFANRTPQSLQGPSFISSTGYILRLFKLLAPPDSSSSSDSDTPSADPASDDANEGSQAPLRVHRAHARPGVYTTIASANRAARNLQIELSHEKEPRRAMTRIFQQRDLETLNAKLLALDSAARPEHGCWRSRFNACGRGGDGLELVVEETRICGPRNV